jgi:hypothetical protein
LFVALTEATDFKQRLNSNVAIYALGKKPGKDLGAYFRLYRLLRELQPDIVHTRNIAGWHESQVSADAEITVVFR